MDYLDVTLNLLNGLYKPFQGEINYIHKELNHTQSITKQWPFSVELRLSKLSSDKNVFIQAFPVYQKVLKQAGYNHKLSYNNSGKYSSNKNNNKDNFSSNNKKNNNNYNNKFMINANDNWDNNNNNKKKKIDNHWEHIGGW